MAAMLKASAVAVLAALTISTAVATNTANHVDAHTVAAAGHGQKVVFHAPPTPTPAALVGVAAVCRSWVKTCCWNPFLCGVVHKSEEVTVVVDCAKSVLVEVPCTLAPLPAGVHELVEETVELDAAARPGFHHGATHPVPPSPPQVCYEHKKVQHQCHKVVTVTKAYPRVCFKKSCGRTTTPEHFKAPEKYVAWAFGEDVISN
ncbi:hypothetical protein BU14_0202s0031 [Porphyra umbilicalis]|uniref:Uncharacterized protein n=1 Tax=Porphyra umbilicalis TaxID=2786 RepID=A0A1X6P5Y1_PORUM|nr:hypothetical protein BU14_0202s0031 [Porphyra umbilicalis]|eukprot:OSX76244.1 hypothetical protein BU14_0202s0031 [Porphyra umbilicalis]